MARANFNRNSFLGGEFSPKTLGRTDLPQYQHAAEKLLNFVALPQGGATRRPGSRFYLNTQSDADTKIFPYIFSENEAYILQFSNNDFRVTRKEQTGSGPEFTTNLATTNVDAEVDLDYDTQGADIFEGQSAFIGDFVFLVNQNSQPLSLQRTAKDTFDLVNLRGVTTEDDTIRYLRVPYAVNQDSTLTLTPSATTGAGITVTASAPLFDAGTGHDDTYWRITHGGTEGVFKITSTSSTTVATADVVVTLGGTTATDDWQEQAWSDVRGWPRTVSIFESRVIFGGNETYPDTIWMSEINAFFKMTVPVGATAQSDSAKNFTIQSNQADLIQWLSPGRQLAAGTLGTEYTITGTTEDIVQVDVESSHGSNFSEAERIGSSTYFISRDGRTINEFVFDFDTDVFESVNIMQLSEHLYRRQAIADFEDGDRVEGSNLNPPRLKQLAYMESQKVLWAIDTFGGLLSMTRDRTQRIAAWSHHRLGGTRDEGINSGGGATGDLFPFVQSIAVIPGPNGEDELWMVVERTINSVKRVYLEFISFNFEEGLAYDRQGYADAYLYDNLSGAGGDTVTGLAHLEGEEVEIFDCNVGRKRAVQTVAGGSITVTDGDVDRVIVGINYDSIVIPVRLNQGSVIGSGQGAIKRIDEVVIRFYASRAAQIGTKDGSLDIIDLQDVTLAANAYQPPFNGDYDLKFDSGYDRDGQLKIQSLGPYPLTVDSVVTRYVTYEV